MRNLATRVSAFSCFGLDEFLLGQVLVLVDRAFERRERHVTGPNAVGDVSASESMREMSDWIDEN